MTFEDLPLFPEAEPPAKDKPSERDASTGAAPEADEGTAPPARGTAGTAPPEPEPPLVPRPRYQLFPARFVQRLGAFLFDVAALVGVTVAAALAATALGVEPSAADWAPLLVFAAAFSFLYTTVPLAFWGVTPGMAAVGLVARSPGNRPLTFRQAVVRWLCGALTLALAGLPALLALGGSSLADRASGSATLSRR